MIEWGKTSNLLNHIVLSHDESKTRLPIQKLSGSVYVCKSGEGGLLKMYVKEVDYIYIRM